MMARIPEKSLHAEDFILHTGICHDGPDCPLPEGSICAYCKEHGCCREILSKLENLDEDQDTHQSAQAGQPEDWIDSPELSGFIVDGNGIIWRQRARA